MMYNYFFVIFVVCVCIKGKDDVERIIHGYANAEVNERNELGGTTLVRLIMIKHNVRKFVKLSASR